MEMRGVGEAKGLSREERPEPAQLDKKERMDGVVIEDDLDFLVQGERATGLGNRPGPNPTEVIAQVRRGRAGAGVPTRLKPLG